MNNDNFVSPVKNFPFLAEDELKWHYIFKLFFFKEFKISVTMTTVFTTWRPKSLNYISPDYVFSNLPKKKKCEFDPLKTNWTWGFFKISNFRLSMMEVETKLWYIIAISVIYSTI